MDLLSQIMNELAGFATMSTPAKAAAMIMVLLSVWKSSYFQPMWAKLGAAQVIVAPVLGMALAMCKMPHLDLASLKDALLSGGSNGLLAIAMHELISAAEAMPIIGAKYKGMMAFFDNLLFKPKA
jgi:hypothetical protein